MARTVLPHVLAACALAPAGVVAQAPAASAAAPAAGPSAAAPLVESCTTTTLPHAQIEAGAHSQVTCTWVDSSFQASRASRSGVIAIHHAGSSGGGSYLNVTGSCSGGISFSAGHAWNDRISSTTHYVCGTIKHFVNSDYTLGPETTHGSHGLTQDLSAYTDNLVSSIAYAP